MKYNFVWRGEDQIFDKDLDLFIFSWQFACAVEFKTQRVECV